VVAAALLTSGCTFVRIEDAAGVRHQAYLGPYQGQAAGSGADGQGLTVSRTEILGLGAVGGGLVLGWAREHAVRGRGGDDCRVVIFRLPDDPGEAQRWRELIAGRPDICVVRDEKAEGGNGDATL
jgi:hypothetical protein